MFLTNFIFIVSHLKAHPAVHLNTSKAPTSLQSKRKVYEKVISFRYSYVPTHVKKMIANKNSNIITIATKIIMLLLLAQSKQFIQACLGTFNNIQP